MISRMRFFLLFVIVLKFACPPAQASDDVFNLSLSEALAQTVQHNKTINYYQLDTVRTGLEIDIARAIYVPQVQAVSSWERVQWDTSAGENYHDQNIFSLVTSINQLHATGGTTSVSLSSKAEGRQFLETDDRLDNYLSQLSLRYDHPLFRGSGKDITNSEINKALVNNDFSLQQFESVKNTSLFETFEAYFRLYRTMENLRLKQEIRKNSQEIYDVVNEKVKLRKLPITDLNTMQATLLRQDREIVELENRSQQALRQLILTIYSEAMQSEFQRVAVATTPDRLSSFFSGTNLGETIDRVLQVDINLVELREKRKLLQLDKIQARNDVKPILNVSLEAGLDGYDDDHWYDAFDRMDGYHVSVSGTLAFPWRNTAAEKKLFQVENQLSQVGLQVKEREDIVINNIHELFDNLETAKRILAISEDVARLSEENLNNQIERLVGSKTTVLDTLDFQTAFIEAELQTLEAKFNYVMLIGTYYWYRSEKEVLIGAGL